MIIEFEIQEVMKYIDEIEEGIYNENNLNNIETYEIEVLLNATNFDTVTKKKLLIY